MIENRLKILCADDDKDDCDMFQEALKHLSIEFDLELAGNGVEALKKIKMFSPDIIFLDINMPLKCGKEILKEIRSDIFHSSIPVIMLSTSCNEEDVNETFLSEANFYAVKPGCFEDLISILEKIFSKYWNGIILNQNREEYLLRYTTKKSIN